MDHCKVGVIPVLSGSICWSVAVSYHPPDTGYESWMTCVHTESHELFIT